MENLTEPLIGKLKKYKQAMYTVAQATTVTLIVTFLYR